MASPATTSPRGQMERTRVPCIRFAKLDCLKSIAAELERQTRRQLLQESGCVVLSRDLAREQSLPKTVESCRLESLLNVLDCRLCGKDTQTGKGGAQEGEAKEVVTMAMGDVKCCEAFVGDGGTDPVDEGESLRGGNRSVDEDGFRRGVDEGYGDGGKG
ncbi:hypothetical protein MMC13_000002 [Lambiella insularis]|nr:hypothetical protein [Lambiella insularis]